MDYEELSTKEKRSLNGMVAQFMDVYIRQNRVWMPEQMCIDFLNVKNEEYHSDFLEEMEDGDRKEQLQTVLSWILSKKGQEHVLERMTKKYDKDNDIAVRDSPITERVRFGIWPTCYYDISYGLKGDRGFDRMTTEELRSIKHSAWTVEHVEHELKSKYGEDIRKVFGRLPLNHFEMDFSDYWLTNFYSLHSPVLIIYINGLRPQFGYLEYKGKAYSSYRDTGVPSYDPNVEYTRFRYDFMLVKSSTKKSCFIDIVSDIFPANEHDKSVQRIRMLQAKENGFDYITFTHSEVKKNIAGCFTSLKKYL